MSQTPTLSPASFLAKFRRQQDPMQEALSSRLDPALVGHEVRAQRGKVKIPVAAKLLRQFGKTLNQPPPAVSLLLSRYARFQHG